MQLSDIPAKFPIPFADSAVAPYIRTIPQTPAGVPGQAALSTGFPPENFSPVAAGGVPPFGEDFNGLLFQMSSWNQWQSCRAFQPYDATFQTQIGGYPKGTIVESLVESLLFYASIVENNVTNPDTGGAGWIVWNRRLTANYDLYVNGTTGNDSNSGVSPATAKKTIQAAVTTAWTFPPSQFTITIHVADGTYNEIVNSPLIPGPPCVIVGNVGTPANVTVNGATGHTFLVQGPNSMTIQSLKATNSLAGAGACFAADKGATLSTTNTVSGSSLAYVFLANGSGTVLPGNHTFSGSTVFAFACFRDGGMALVPGSVYTISTAITVSFFAFATTCGVLEVPGTGVPTFSGAVNVTGTRFNATFNGVIACSQGANYFPGTIAGGTSTGGQYG